MDGYFGLDVSLAIDFMIYARYYSLQSVCMNMYSYMWAHWITYLYYDVPGHQIHHILEKSVPV